MESAMSVTKRATVSFEMEPNPKVSETDMTLDENEVGSFRANFGLKALRHSDSRSSMDSESTCIRDPKEIRGSVVNLIGGFYCLVLVICSFAFEISVSTVEHVSQSKYDGFYIYLYSASLIFFFYCYLFLLRHTPYFSACDMIEHCKFWKKSPIPPNIRNELINEELLDFLSSKRKVTYSAPAGSMFLRLGALVFGVIGIISCILEAIDYIFFGMDHPCWSSTGMACCLLYSAFCLLQLYFVFLNSQLTVHRFRNTFRIGTMHVVATNLSVWIRSIVLEQTHSIEHIEGEGTHTSNTTVSNSDSESSESHEVRRLLRSVLQLINNSFIEPDNLMREHPDHIITQTGPFESHESSSVEVVHQVQLHVTAIVKNSSHTLGNICYDSIANKNVIHTFLKQITPFFTACIVEYSLICAAIVFILFLNIGTVQGVRRKRRKQNLKVDCSSATRGLFCGIIFVILAIVSMILFWVMVGDHHDAEAVSIFLITDIILYVVSWLCTVGALYQMHKLQYMKEVERGVLLDDILLMIAVVGQLIMCIFSMVGSSRTGHSHIDDSESFQASPTTLMNVTNGLRIVQVLTQTALILIGQRMIAHRTEAQEKKHGRELITFLLVINIALWLINTFEAQKIGEMKLMIDFYGAKTWAIITHSVGPLCIFYRFHSSVCFAEIWKNAYKTHEPQPV